MNLKILMGILLFAPQFLSFKIVNQSFELSISPRNKELFTAQQSTSLIFQK